MDWGIHRVRAALVLGGIFTLTACGDTAVYGDHADRQTVPSVKRAPLEAEGVEAPVEKLRRFERAVILGDLTPYSNVTAAAVHMNDKTRHRRHDDEKSVPVEKRAPGPDEGEENDRLDPSGIFEVRETGFLPAPVLRVAEIDDTTVHLEWTSIRDADGYTLTYVYYGSGGQAVEAHTQTLRAARATIQTDGHRIQVSVRAFSTKPARRSDTSNKVSIQPTDS
ncbi:MAG: fibronectin type III domain-containing protein [Myxococcota bacterium]|nr:fibronectin type III domain-containing protein [Myxococcota bacterium]